MRYAYVESGTVEVVVDTDSLGRRFGKHLLAKFHQCPDWVRVGDSFDGETFTAEPLEADKSAKVAAIKSEGAALMALALPYDDFLAAVWGNLPGNVQARLQPIVDAGQAARQAVTNATTREEVEAVEPNWPEM
jgi:hypothetical protein